MYGLKDGGLQFGANITGGEGGSTRVACDDLTNDRHYTLAEVDKNGAVVKDPEGRFQRLHLEDRKEGGVQVLRGINDNPVLKSGETLGVQVGSYTLKIEGTDSSGVLFNGTSPTIATEQNERIRYPHPKQR